MICISMNLVKATVDQAMQPKVGNQQQYDEWLDRYFRKADEITRWKLNIFLQSPAWSTIFD